MWKGAVGGKKSKLNKMQVQVCTSWLYIRINQSVINYVTNESDNKLILFERRFDVIFTSFSSSFKVRYD